VERARRHITDHYAEALELGDIARHAGITAPHLIRLFKEAMDITPAAYLWRYRTSAAARLLRETGLSTAEVAYRTGFANPQHFSRVFRQHHGLPPRAWRSREWRSNVSVAIG
jgi:transcriptional regulator GlxA family with amidase domain